MPAPDASRRNVKITSVLTGTSVQSFASIVALVENTLPLPPPDPTTLVQVPLAPDFWKRRFVSNGCATAPLLYTASMALDASGANASDLHSKVIDLSMTAVVFGGDAPTLLAPNPLIQVAATSAFVDRATLQSTS